MKVKLQNFLMMYNKPKIYIRWEKTQKKFLNKEQKIQTLFQDLK